MTWVEYGRLLRVWGRQASHLSAMIFLPMRSQSGLGSALVFSQLSQTQRHVTSSHLCCSPMRSPGKVSSVALSNENLFHGPENRTPGPIGKLGEYCCCHVPHCGDDETKALVKIGQSLNLSILGHGPQAGAN